HDQVAARRHPGRPRWARQHPGHHPRGDRRWGLEDRTPRRRLRRGHHGVHLHGAVGYTSSVSQRDYYRAERAREAAEIDTMPEAERQEIHDIYATKGFSGDLLEHVVETITANRDSWLSTMMDEELHIQPVQTADIFRSAVVIT